MALACACPTDRPSSAGTPGPSQYSVGFRVRSRVSRAAPLRHGGAMHYFPEALPKGGIFSMKRIVTSIGLLGVLATAAAVLPLAAAPESTPKPESTVQPNVRMIDTATLKKALA